MKKLVIVLLPISSLLVMVALLVALDMIRIDMPFVLNSALLAIGVLGSLASIIQIIDTPKKPKGTILKRKVALNQDCFVDREEELDALFRCLRKNPNLVNVHGDKGVGKSEVLRILTDVFNKRVSGSLKKRFQGKEIRYLQSNYHAIYFDVFDKTGIEDLKKDVCAKAFPRESPSYEVFVENLERKYAHRKLIVILDNFNNQALGASLASLIQFHWSVRPDDVFVVGSIDKLNVFVFPVERIEILPLKEKAILEYAEKKGRMLNDEQLKDMLYISNGLPIYLEIILNSKLQDLESAALYSTINSFIFEQIVPKFDEETLLVLKHSAFLNLVSTDIDKQVLKEFGLRNTDDALRTLKRHSLILGELSSSNRSFKVHDRVRDLLVEKYLMDSSQINANIAEYYKRKQRKRESSIHYLISNELINNTKYVLDVINDEIEKENLPFLLTVGRIFERYNRNRKVACTSEDFVRRVLYAHLFSTMGIGNYLDATRIVETIVLGPQNLPRLDELKNREDFDFHFLIADLDHLLNKYAQSIDSFYRLASRANAIGFFERIPRCLWGVAHSYRHQGKDLELALTYYEQCETISQEQNDVRYYCKALNGKMGIHLLRNNFSFPFRDVLQKAYEKGSTDEKSKTELLSTMKYHAIYLRLIGNYPEAFQYISRAHEETKRLGKRWIYNLEFEFAEYYRDIKEYEKAYEKYLTAYTFSEENHDRNLKANCILGIILVELSSGRLYRHNNRNEMVDELLEVITLTMEADIHITNLQAKIVLEFLKIQEEPNVGFRPDLEKYLHRVGLLREASVYRCLGKDALDKMHLILL